MSRNATFWTLPYARTRTGVLHRLACVVASEGDDVLTLVFQCGGRSDVATFAWVRPDAVDVRWCRLCPRRTSGKWAEPFTWTDEERASW